MELPHGEPVPVSLQPRAAQRLHPGRIKVEGLDWWLTVQQCEARPEVPIWVAH
jgi:hypothetical protein